MSLITIDGLTVEYATRERTIRAANEVSFSIEENEAFGLVGESGCGKSTIAKSILGILPNNGRIAGGSMEFAPTGIDLADASRQQLERTRWSHVSIISQSAMNALDPVYTIGDQITEAIQLHEGKTKSEQRRRVEELLDMVGLDPQHRSSYPHQLSGGMRQRAMIAMALVLEPDLIIADEPTTALDVITQDHILDEINTMTERVGSSLLVITHDISVVAETCDEVGVMYGGELVETGPVEEVFTDPEHPYTLGLINAFPTLEGKDEALITMPGEPPDLSDPPRGCNFYDRCPYREDRCRESDPAFTNRTDGQKAACFVSEELDIETEYEALLDEEDSLWQRL